MGNPYSEQLRMALREAANPDRAEQEKRYLKSDDSFLGISVPYGHRLAKDFRRTHPELSIVDIRTVAADLWDGLYHEEKRLAVQLLDACCSKLERKDWPLLECWVRQAGSWDLLDEIAAHLLGSLVDRYPDLDADFDRWITDENLWVRRAALVSHVLRIRHATVAPERVRRLCAPLVADSEYFIQKALGWVLRECAVKDPAGTVSFLVALQGKIKRSVLREVVRKLDPALQHQVVPPRA